MPSHHKRTLQDTIPCKFVTIHKQYFTRPSDCRETFEMWWVCIANLMLTVSEGISKIGQYLNQTSR